MIVVGIVIRRTVEELPVFRRMHEHHKDASAPLGHLLKRLGKPEMGGRLGARIGRVRTFQLGYVEAMDSRIALTVRTRLGRRRRANISGRKAVPSPECPAEVCRVIETPEVGNLADRTAAHRRLHQLAFGAL
ncbi:hypothetical protein ASC92_05695 [Variovorax sp. Root411]|nr:hypothetical protein ASC92_05695 [Variovorax sp. Root411]